MNRDLMLAVVTVQREPFDIIAISGGATGVGIALDAVSRDLKVLLLEHDNFGSGTSSRSTKIIHGGVRYVTQGRVGLVNEALKERAHLLVNAPHLVSPQAFAESIENVTERAKYFIVLKLYDLLSSKHGMQGSDWLSKREFGDTVSNGKAANFPAQSVISTTPSYSST